MSYGHGIVTRTGCPHPAEGTKPNPAGAMMPWVAPCARATLRSLPPHGATTSGASTSSAPGDAISTLARGTSGTGGRRGCATFKRSRPSACARPGRSVSSPDPATAHTSTKDADSGVSVHQGRRAVIAPAHAAPSSRPGDVVGLSRLAHKAVPVELLHSVRVGPRKSAVKIKALRV